MSENYHEKYIENRKSLIRVICRTSQWSGIDESDIFAWIDNFKDSFGKYIAIKLLIHSIYYSEKNIVSLLKYGIYEQIHSHEIKKKLIIEDIILQPRSETNANLRDLVLKSVYIPLLDKSKPGESGNQMTRYLIQKLNIDPTQTFFIDDLKLSDIKNKSALIFLDDCIGSGQQLIDFFKKDNVKSKIDYSKENLVPVYYLTLTGYKKNIDNVRKSESMKDISIIACDELNENNRVFNRNNIIWNDDDEFEEANNYFDKLEKELGINKFGYANLDFSVFIHNTVPDWSLPIYWMETSDWKPLIQRKNSSLY